MESIVPTAAVVEPPRFAVDDPFVRKVGRPGEEFWGGLGAVDWREYMASIEREDRARAIQDSHRVLIVTTERLLVMDQNRERIQETPLDRIGNVAVVPPPGLLRPGEEAMLHVEVFTEAGRLEMGWSTSRAEADGFARKLQDLAAQYVERRVDRDVNQNKEGAGDPPRTD